MSSGAPEPPHQGDWAPVPSASSGGVFDARAPVQSALGDFDGPAPEPSASPSGSWGEVQPAALGQAESRLRGAFGSSSGSWPPSPPPAQGGQEGMGPPGNEAAFD